LDLTPNRIAAILLSQGVESSDQGVKAAVRTLQGLSGLFYSLWEQQRFVQFIFVVSRNRFNNGGVSNNESATYSWHRQVV
jgi:hypothetical protein